MTNRSFGVSLLAFLGKVLGAKKQDKKFMVGFRSTAEQRDNHPRMLRKVVREIKGAAKGQGFDPPHIEVSLDENSHDLLFIATASRR